MPIANLADLPEAGAKEVTYTVRVVDGFHEVDRSYSIFLDAATHQLFGYAELEDEARWQAVAKTAVCQRWWKHMREIMPSNPDNSPVSRELKEVFHIAK